MGSLEQYRELIARAEATAAASPRLYKVQLALLAGLGIGYIVLLVAALAACGFFIAGLLLAAKSLALIKYGLLPLAAAYILARALWFRLPLPQGRRLTPAEVPALFAEIEHVRKMVRAKSVHEVLLTPDFNAAVVQVPRLGLLGWPKRYLIVGLPLLACLPPYQVRAVLAHEFGHLAQNHAHFGNWIYRIRESWYRILEGLPARRSALSRLVTRFFDWYAPQFNAYSFVLARANEYEADRVSARVTSRADAGDALAAVYARSDYIDTRFWGEFYARAQTQAEPPRQPFSDYVAALRSIPAQHSACSLASALARETGLNDTHPALKDRLAALGVQPNIPLSFQRSAAHVLLQERRLPLMEELDTLWRESIAGHWKERHEFLRETSHKLTRYEAIAAHTQLSADEQWDYACALETLKGGRAALPVLDRLLERAPAHAAACYARGRILLEDNEERGVADVERAMQLDESAREPGSQLLYSFFYARNELRRCDKYRHILSLVARERQLAAEERRCLKRREIFQPHRLQPGQLERWMQALSAHHGLKRAWLAQRRVRHMQSVPAYVLVVDFGPLKWVREATLESIYKSLPADTSCLIVNKSWRNGAYRKIKALSGALVFRAPAP